MSSVLKKNNGLQEFLKSAPGMYFYLWSWDENNSV